MTSTAFPFAHENIKAMYFFFCHFAFMAAHILVKQVKSTTRKNVP
jgi:hypothetical protein